MELKVIRKQFGKNSTGGELYINGKLECFTLEDTDRDKNMDGDLDDDGESKIYGKTAIPYGTYPIILRKTGTTHNLYSQEHFWEDRGFPGFEKKHKGTLWLRNIKGFEYVLIHIGIITTHTAGCLLVGEKINLKSEPFNLSRSTAAYVHMYEQVVKALEAGETVTITYTK